MSRYLRCGDTSVQLLVRFARSRDWSVVVVYKLKIGHIKTIDTCQDGTIRLIAPSIVKVLL